MRRNDDGSIPIEAVPGLEHALALRSNHPGMWLDGAGLARLGIGDTEVTALGVGIHEIGLARYGNREEAISAANRVPFARHDPARFVGLRRAAPVAVVLQAATDVVGIPIVHEDVVVLREAEIAEDVEVGAAITAHLHTAITA